MMKKTFMLAGMIAAGVALTSTSALADTRGTQTFTANIAANTCTITGLNQNIDLGNIQKSVFAAAWGFSTPETINFEVANCPNSLTQVKVTPTYNADPSYAWVIVNTGTAKGVHLNTQVAVDLDHTKRWENGVEKDFTLTGGGVSIPFSYKIERNGTDTVTTGSLLFNSTFLFDFA
ncbi:type 1 fimbrial protein [Salmonella enterica subsp. enterica serovar Kimberley]|nr:type 1 fimbrial protein [Salmonella enterica subsp. enterica serovar Kimberley]